MKKTAYDLHYQQQHYFGNPYPGLVEFFKLHPSKGHVLDLGCGQGRDALTLGRLGYTVKGIDVSTVGLEQMNQTAREEQLNVRGEVGDIHNYPVSDEYDIVLLDSMLHFNRNDVEKETKLVQRIATELKSGGILAVFMIQGKEREQYLKSILNGMELSWEVMKDQHIDYPEFNARYHMYILQKNS